MKRERYKDKENKNQQKTQGMWIAQNKQPVYLCWPAHRLNVVQNTFTSSTLFDSVFIFLCLLLSYFHFFPS